MADPERDPHGLEKLDAWLDPLAKTQVTEKRGGLDGQDLSILAFSEGCFQNQELGFFCGRQGER